MQKEFLDTVNNAGKQAYEAAKEVTAVNASTFETVLEKQLEIANQIVELGSKQARIISEFKDVPSAFKAQTALIQESADQAVSNARDAMEIVNKVRGAYDKLFQKGLKDATDAAKKAQANLSVAA